MGGRGSRSSSGGIKIVGGQQPIQASMKNVVYQDLTKANVADIEDSYDIDTKLAIKQYIREDTMPNGYSMSQNLNYKLDNGMKLNANEQFVMDELDRSMHTLGYDTTLNRACHADLLDNLGVKNYQNMSDSALNSALAGITYQSKSYSSTAYDVKKNPFISGSQSGGREVYMNIKAGKDTKVVLGNKTQAEIVISKGTNYRITGAHFDGSTAYPRVGGAMKRVVIDVEIIN